MHCDEGNNNNTRDPKLIHLGKASLPSTFKLQPANSQGYGLFAAQDFKKGDILYESPYELVPDDGTHYSYEIEDGTIVIEDPKIHYVKTYGQRARYPYDGFINHSCDANTSYTLNKALTPEDPKGSYTCFAIKDIKKGEEFTVEYSMFDWDCDGHQFHCKCGSENCRGWIAGFSAMPRELQEKFLPIVDDHVRQRYYSEKGKQNENLTL